MFDLPPLPSSPLIFTPHVPRRLTANGWSSDVQRAFIAVLAQTGIVAAAARSVGRSPRSAYQLRERAGAESFAAAWDRALVHATHAVMDKAHTAVLAPERVPILYRGRIVAWRERPNDRLLIAALRAIDAIRRVRDPGSTRRARANRAAPPQAEQ